MTEIEQLDPAASKAPQVVPPAFTAKSLGLAPAIDTLLMVSGALPVFWRVAVCAALVVPVTAVNVNGPGVSTATGMGTNAKLAVTVSGALMVTEVEALPALATVPLQFEKV
jgi:hypothetical protein